jgi:hypothetical protein
MRYRAVPFLAMALVLASLCAYAQKTGVQVQPEDKMAKFLPATVFLDGENVPTQKRNAVLVEIGGKKTIIANVDTAGYSSAYQEKYTGVILTQAPVKIGSLSLPAGAYGFGQSKQGEHDAAQVTVHVYDIGGKEVGTFATEHEANMKGVRPLQVKSAADGAAQLYFGPYHAAISGE